MKARWIKGLFFVLPMLLTAKTTMSIDSLQLREAIAISIGQSTINLDGKLDEPAWENAVWQSDFTQRNPNDGSPASYKTEFAVLYDAGYIYFGARAFDPEPQNIAAILTRRDNYSQSDWMYVSIDSYNDHRTAFEFGLNAAGVKHDVRRFDDQNADADWDAVWDGAVDINPDGWSAEWRIPFRELRFNAASEMEWGLQFYRELPRQNNEVAVWNYWSQAEQGFVSRYGKLKGLKDVTVSKPIYVMPYLAGNTKLSKSLQTPVHREKYDLFANVGGDLRYSSPLGLTLNATINPDFGQVEADPADFNLTEFETYFSEKRPFFMEGANILRYSLGFGDGDGQNNSLFYSRRIGRTPHFDPVEDDSKEVISTFKPDATNILGALKVTGKTAGGLSLGVMEAVTTQEKGTVYYADKTKDVSVVEPLTNFWLTRVQQDFNTGRTSVGGIFTAVNRRLENTGLERLHRSAYTGGIDIDHKFFGDKYQFQGSIAFSNVNGDTLAIQRTQKSSARYFNRVDAKHVEYDPQATSLSGYALKGVLQKTSGHWRGASGVIAYSPGLEINDMGFLTRVDNINQFNWVQYYQWEPGKFIRNYRLNFNQWANWNYGGLRTSLGGNINAHLIFNNNWGYGVGLNHGWAGFDCAHNRGGPAIYVPPYWNVWSYINSDGRDKLFAQIFGFYFTNSDNVHGYEVDPSVTWRPRQNLQLSADLSLNYLDDTWAWIGKANDENGQRQYIWAQLHQKVAALTIRTDFTITPNLTVQYYAQPYLTSGKYFDLMRLVDAHSSRYHQRFEKYGDQISYDHSNGEYVVDKGKDGSVDYTFSGEENFNYKQFRSNLVLRWEYRTGSALYLVWSQGFTDYETFQPFNVGRDLRRLFQTNGDNVLMIKVSQLLTL